MPLSLLQWVPCRLSSPQKASAVWNSTGVTGKPCFERGYRSGFHRARLPSRATLCWSESRLGWSTTLPDGSTNWSRCPSIFVALTSSDRVWDLLLDIPLGSTMTYGELARKLNRPNGARAVGLAVGRNPVGIIVPCHRVVGSNGSLTGYGGGLDRKRWLLEHECSAAPLFRSASGHV